MRATPSTTPSQGAVARMATPFVRSNPWGGRESPSCPSLTHRSGFGRGKEGPAGGFLGGRGGERGRGGTRGRGEGQSGAPRAGGAPAGATPPGGAGGHRTSPRSGRLRAAGHPAGHAHGGAGGSVQAAVRHGPLHLGADEHRGELAPLAPAARAAGAAAAGVDLVA